jgi:hypothetical protein
LTNALVIGNYCPTVRFVAPQDHVAAGLATKYEPGVFEGRSNLPSRQVSGKLARHRECGFAFPRLRSFDIDEFPVGLGGDWIAGIPAIFDI